MSEVPLHVSQRSGVERGNFKKHGASAPRFTVPYERGTPGRLSAGRRWRRVAALASPQWRVGSHARDRMGPPPVLTGPPRDGVPEPPLLARPRLISVGSCALLGVNYAPLAT